MSTKGQIQVEELLPGYFSGEISKEDRIIVEEWKNASPEKTKQFSAFQKIWEVGGTLALMKQFNVDEALKKINGQILGQRKYRIIGTLQKIAAVLIVPLLIYSGYITFISEKVKNMLLQEVSTWNDVKTTTGMYSKFTLPDGSKVWLNSSTNLRYPLKFGRNREVEVTGEAFFDVQKDEKHPFIVKAGKINIEVVGTSFNVLNYPDENKEEIVLKSGKVKLFSGDILNKNEITILKPGQRAVYDFSNNKLVVSNVEVNKYTSWIEGKLMFIDDPMDEVVRKLNRRYNVNIILQNEGLQEYVYKATFEDETLDQILELLKISAPIEYTSKSRKLMPDGTFSKRTIIIKERNMK